MYKPYMYKKNINLLTREHISVLWQKNA